MIQSYRNVIEMTDATYKVYANSLEIAIKKEQDAQRFYEGASALVDNQGVKKFFDDLKNVEVGHERMLSEFRDKINRQYGIQPEDLDVKDVKDLGIGKYLHDVHLQPNSTYQDALIIAMKKEEGAVEFYTTQAMITQDGDLRSLFEKLRDEEIGHLKSLEVRYDDDILTEN